MSKLVNICPKPYPKATTQGGGCSTGLQEEAKVRKKKLCFLKKVLNTVTIAVTWIGGSNFSITIPETYRQGMFFLLCSLAEVVSFGLIAYFYAPCMAEFLRKLLIAEVMDSIYKNNYVRAIIAIFSTIPEIGRVAVSRLKSMSYILGDIWMVKIQI